MIMISSSHSLLIVITGIVIAISLINIGIGTLHPGVHADVNRLFPFTTDSTPSSRSVEDDFPKEPRPRPPLDSIVQGWNVTSDPSWLLNVAVVGFPKCGTSTMMFHLQNHPEFHMFGDERCELSGNQQVPLIRDLYEKYPAGDFVRGIKCPQDLESELSMINYQKYFHKTDFIVGIRHPILWFESFYNFRIHNKFRMPPAQTLRGICGRKQFGVCTYRSNFHLFLGYLGKTNMSDPAELQYIDSKYHRRVRVHPNDQRKVFLYEVSQLSDPDETREVKLRLDLQRFLHLRQPIPPMIWFKPGANHTNERLLARVNALKIDICDSPYDDLRLELLGIAANAAKWITTYFIHSPDVVVSSKEYFTNYLMKKWEVDPCIERRKMVAAKE